MTAIDVGSVDHALTANLASGPGRALVNEPPT
jgi:hypothetical protein